MKLACDNCGYLDEARNFHTILATSKMKNGFVTRTVYLECPICERQEFLNTFEGLYVDGVVLKYGRVFQPDLDLHLSADESSEYVAKRINEMRKRFEKEVSDNFEKTE